MTMAAMRARLQEDLLLARTARHLAEVSAVL
jgi:hypothetical protein